MSKLLKKGKVSELAGGWGEGPAGLIAHLHHLNPPGCHNKELYLPIRGGGPGTSQGISDIRCHGNAITRKRGSRWRGNPRDSLATSSHGNHSKLINNSPFPSCPPPKKIPTKLLSECGCENPPGRLIERTGRCTRVWAAAQGCPPSSPSPCSRTCLLIWYKIEASD